MRGAPSAVATLVALVLLAGCSGLGGPAAPDPTTPTGTESEVGPSPTATPSEIRTPSSSPNGHDGANASNTIAYAALSTEGKAAFAAARTGYARFITDTEYVTGDPFDPAAFQQFSAHQYLLRNGTYYEIESSFGEAYATYSIEATLVDGSRENATAVNELPDEVRSQVRWAVENGSYATPLGKWASLPASLDDLEYVTSQDEVYRLRLAVGDARVQRVSLEMKATRGGD